MLTSDDFSNVKHNITASWSADIKFESSSTGCKVRVSQAPEPEFSQSETSSKSYKRASKNLQNVFSKNIDFNGVVSDLNKIVGAERHWLRLRAYKLRCANPVLMNSGDVVLQLLPQTESVTPSKSALKKEVRISLSGNK